MDQGQKTSGKQVNEANSGAGPSRWNRRSLAKLFLILAIGYTIFFELFTCSAWLARITVFSFPSNIILSMVVGQILGLLAISLVYDFLTQKVGR